MEETLFGHGALQDPIDNRDLPFAGPTIPFDWDLGFDIELVLGYRAICKDQDEFFGSRGRSGWGVDRYREIVSEIKARDIPPFKIPTKNQYSSSSCTGQGLSYYISVLNMIETGKWIDISARDIYAYITLGEGSGAYLRDALKLAVDRGISSEELVKSYLDDGTTTEKFMITKPTETEEIKAIRRALQSKNYKVIPYNGDRMEQTAWATLLNFGVYFGVIGENNGTWMSEYPLAPTKVQWAHALYNGKCGKDPIKGNYTGHKNSWGDSCGINGWQKLTKDWYEKMLSTGMASEFIVFNPWTLEDKPNIEENMKFYKEKNNNTVYILGNGDGLYHPIYSGKVALDVFAKSWADMKIEVVDSIPKDKIGYRIGGFI